MNVPMAVTLILLTAGCAHSEKKIAAPVVVSSGTPVSAESSGGLSAVTRMPLPYTFSRRGVKIRVNSVEFSGDKLKVSVTLEEVRGDAGWVLASTLMEPRSETKKVLPYQGYLRDTQLQTIPQINLKANEKISVDLLYQVTPEMVGNPVEIQFTTGKWWSSRT